MNKKKVLVKIFETCNPFINQNLVYSRLEAFSPIIKSKKVAHTILYYRREKAGTSVKEWHIVKLSFLSLEKKAKRMKQTRLEFLFSF